MKMYMLKRILLSLVSFFIVVGTVMVLTYSLIDRTMIFQSDGAWKKYSNNEKTMYEQRKYEEYGYLTLEEATDYLKTKYQETDGEAYISNAQYQAAIAAIKTTSREENADLAEFKMKYLKDGYKVNYLPQITSGSKLISSAYLYATKDINVFVRIFTYFSKMFTFETIYDVDDPNLTDRYIRWEWDKRSNMPALVGSGTTHKYLIYFDNKFPFIHQNLFHFHLGISNAEYIGSDVADVMVNSQGEIVKTEQEYPIDLGTGITHKIGYDFHTATYNSGELTLAELTMFNDRYTICKTNGDGLTMLGNSFIMGIIASILAYLFGLPLGVLMARKKDKIADKIGNVYIILIMALPSLAYIFMFSAIGTGLFGLPYKYANAEIKVLAYILPILSLALPSIGSLMKWMRRYVIDQQNSDYVKFAKSQGLSEREVFSTHIARNAFIYIVHGIPGTILGALTGAIITERVYGISGVGNLLTNAVTSYDNGVIVACTVFYTALSIISLILGDILLTKYDPRISLSGGR